MAHGSRYTTAWAMTVQGAMWRHSAAFELLVHKAPAGNPPYRWALHDTRLPFRDSLVSDGYANTEQAAMDLADRAVKRERERLAIGGAA